MALVRFLAVGFVALTLFYWMVSAYARSLHREKLERDWAERTSAAAETATETAREAFIRTGMKAYEHGLRYRLLLLIYVVPVFVVAVLVYLTNFA